MSPSSSSSAAAAIIGFGFRTLLLGRLDADFIPLERFRFCVIMDDSTSPASIIFSVIGSSFSATERRKSADYCVLRASFFASILKEGNYEIVNERISRYL
jgi:hypothetical protein